MGYLTAFQCRHYVASDGRAIDNETGQGRLVDKINELATNRKNTIRDLFRGIH
jgi:hypothetical protein